MPRFINPGSGDACFISAGALANPSAEYINNMSAVYIDAYGNRWRSNGSSLVSNFSNSFKNRKANVPFKIWGAIQNSAGLRDTTNHVTLEIPFNWYGFRVGVENSASTAQINSLMNVAVSNDALVNPTTPSGVWNNLLFSGVASYSTVACTSGAGTNDAIPTILFSDWLTLPNIARTDGGNGNVLMLRQYIPLTGNTTGNRADIASASLPLSTTRVKCYFKSGDFVTTPAGFTSPTEWTMAPAVWFEFLTDEGLISLLAVGDSITQGSDSSPIINVGGAARLTMESNQLSVALCNEGWASQTSAVYYTNGLNKLNAIKPTIAAFCCWSPNDSDKYTQAGVNRCLTAALQWVLQCQNVGTIAALVTPAPVNGLTPSEESFRRQVVVGVQSICSGGSAILIDRDSVFTNYASSSGGYLPGLNATALHPNGRGYSLESSLQWNPAVKLTF